MYVKSVRYGYGGRWLAEEAFVWSGVSKKREARIRRAVEMEVKDLLIDELTPVIREQVEQEVHETARKQARKDIKKEALEAVPTLRERKAFQTYVKEVELDAHAQAVVASNTADKTEDRKWGNRFRSLFTFVYGGAIIPSLYILHHYFDVPISSPTSGVPLIFLAGGMSFVLMGLVFWAGEHRKGDGKEIQSQREISSDYLRLAERAKAFRIVHAERLDTKKELDELVTSLEKDKGKLDQHHHLRIDDLYDAKDSVRSRIAVEHLVDPIDYFDERLEATEAEAVEEAVASYQEEVR